MSYIRPPAKLGPRPAPLSKQSSAIPNDYHLVVTTEEHVLCCDRTGLSKIFRSGSRGILASRESRDGKGTVAIADSQVVILHNVERGVDRSYRLKGAEGQIRLVDYSPDSSTLYFTTTLLNAVQAYSIKEARLLDPGPTHASLPTVFAISPTSHLLLTASESPATVYIQNLTLRTQPVLLQTQASNSPVSVATFHPERANVFLLGFRDGTLAVYDANRCGKSASTTGEIRSFKSHHTSTGYAATGHVSSTSQQDPGRPRSGITGAAWVPGFSSRIVTVGSDGKCKIVDFDTGRLVKAWHVKAPATSLALLNTRGARDVASRQRSRAAATGDPMTGILLAVGRVDGKVLIFDCGGKMLQETVVDDQAGRVIDVQWIHGAKPKNLGDSMRVSFTGETCWVDFYSLNGRLRARTRTESETEEAIPMLNSSLPASIAGNELPTADADAQADDQEDEDADEEEDYGTVKHSPQGKSVLPPVPMLSKEDYMDLFSPMKPAMPSPAARSPKRKASARPRPRLSSSLFADRSQRKVTSPSKLHAAGQVQPEIEESPPAPRSTDLVDAVQGGSATALSPPIKLEYAPKKTPTHFRRLPGSYINTSSSDYTSSSAISTSSSANSKILADIRRFASTGVMGDEVRKGGNMALLAPYMPSASKGMSAKHGRRRSSGIIRRQSRGLRAEPIVTGGLSSRQAGAESDLGPNDTTQNVIDEVMTGGADDIWLTAESEEEDKAASRLRERRRRRARDSDRTSEHDHVHFTPVSAVDNTLAGYSHNRGDDPGQYGGRSVSSYYSEPPSTVASAYPISSESGDSLEEFEPSDQRNPSAGARGISSHQSSGSQKPPSTIYATIDPRASVTNSSDYSPTTTTPRPTSSHAPSTIYPALAPSTTTYAPSSLDPNSVAVEVNTESGGSLRTATTTSTSTPSAEDVRERDRFFSAAEQLPPGWAESYHGPVEVKRYLPRRGSLAYALDSTGNRRVREERGAKKEGHECCDCCGKLQDEVFALREEVEMLRRALRGERVVLDV